MLKELIEEIIDRLGGLGGLRYIAEDWGQLDYEQPPVQWPCALIDMQEVRCSQTGAGGLLCECEFSIQIAQRAPQRVSANAPDRLKDESLAFSAIIDRIFLKIHAEESENHSPFVLRDIRKVKEPDIQSYILSFATQFKIAKPQITVPLTGFHVRPKPSGKA